MNVMTMGNCKVTKFIDALFTAHDDVYDLQISGNHRDPDRLQSMRFKAFMHTFGIQRYGTTAEPK